MANAMSARRKKAALSVGLELYGYFMTRNLRRNIDIYQFENSFVSKYSAYKDYKKSEKSISNDKTDITCKKVIKLL